MAIISFICSTPEGQDTEIQPACQGPARARTAVSDALGPPAWCRRNTRRRAGAQHRAFGAFIAACLALVLGPTAFARQAPATPALEPSLDAARIVQGWVRSGTLPADAAEPAPKAAAAQVTIRNNGDIIGRGVGLEPAPMIAATREAIAQAALRMADARDALQAQNAASAWAGLAVTLELSGPLIPITPETYNEVDTTCSPGIDGVAVRIGSKLECVFPSTSLMRSWRPGDALASAITAATGDPGLGLRESPQAQPGAIAKARGAVFYRFRTVHVSDTGTFLHRGGRIVLEQNLTEQSLRDWAIDMAAHLCVRAKRATGDRRIAVHYLPASGRDEVQPAGLAEQAVTAAALLKFSVMIEPESASAKDARSCGQRLLEAIASRSGGDPAASPVSAAAFIGAATQIDLPAPGAVKDCFDRCAATLREAVDPKTGFRDTVPQPTRGMVAWGLAALAKFSRTPADQSAAAAAAAAVYSATPIEKLPSQMPWLGWASVTAASAGEPVAAAPALREMREMIWKHQLASADLEPHDQDLAGGIVFTSGSIRLPTWQTARPAAILATMFAEPALTDAGERGPEAGRLLATLRYLRQLAADESVCAMYPLPERARGGIRAALWDQRMPPEATAITLMTVCESLRGFRATPAK